MPLLVICTMCASVYDTKIVSWAQAFDLLHQMAFNVDRLCRACALHGSLCNQMWLP